MPPASGWGGRRVWRSRSSLATWRDESIWDLTKRQVSQGWELSISSFESSNKNVSGAEYKAQSAEACLQKQENLASPHVPAQASTPPHMCIRAHNTTHIHALSLEVPSSLWKWEARGVNALSLRLPLKDVAEPGWGLCLCSVNAFKQHRDSHQVPGALSHRPNKYPQSELIKWPVVEGQEGIKEVWTN